MKKILAIIFLALSFFILVSGLLLIFFAPSIAESNNQPDIRNSSLLDRWFGNGERQLAIDRDIMTLRIIGSIISMVGLTGMVCSGIAVYKNLKAYKK